MNIGLPVYRHTVSLPIQHDIMTHNYSLQHECAMVLRDGKTSGHLEYRILFVRYDTFPPIKIGNSGSMDQFAFAYK